MPREKFVYWYTGILWLSSDGAATRGTHLHTQFYLFIYLTFIYSNSGIISCLTLCVCPWTTTMFKTPSWLIHNGIIDWPPQGPLVLRIICNQTESWEPALKGKLKCYLIRKRDIFSAAHSKRGLLEIEKSRKVFLVQMFIPTSIGITWNTSLPTSAYF